jgi:hypothetical protein
VGKDRQPFGWFGHLILFLKNLRKYLANLLVKPMFARSNELNMPQRLNPV